jgi:hypothetical protein
MVVRIPLFLIAAALAQGTGAAQPQRPQPAAAGPAAQAPQPTISYADLADLALTAPVAAHVRLRRALALRPAEAAGVAPGYTRFYLETEVVALIRGEPGMPTELSYLVDLPNDARGRPARPERRSEWLIFARTVAGRPGSLQLAAPDAQLPFTPDAAERTRAILRAAVAADAPPAISGIGRAFHTPGSVTGTSETQFFLQTARNQPISITVSREAGAQPRWFVSMSEFVDAGATQPRRDSLLWYRLACFLPTQLPATSFADAREHAGAIAADYQLVRQGLGPCQRLRARR